MNSKMIMGHRKKLTGSQGGHQVHDEEEQDWVIKPALRPGFGVKGTVNEYIAGSLAIRTSLNVPEHSVLYLPQQTIDTFPVLSSFSAGHVLGIRYENGVDLEAATRSGLVAHILSGLTGASNQITALGIITTDTWLWNHDRSMGSAPLHRVTPKSCMSVLNHNLEIPLEISFWSCFSGATESSQSSRITRSYDFWGYLSAP